VKRTVTFVAGVLALGVVAYVGSRLWAQQPAGTRPAAPQTRVALLNVRYVFKHYKKYENFIEGLKQKEKKFIETMKSKQNQLEAKNREYQTTQDPAKKEKLEQEIRDIQRTVEDERNKARRDATRELNEETVKIYKEIRDAAIRHAQQYNYEMVLQYEGAITREERDSPGLISRGLSAGGCYPLYWHQGLDISGHVLYALNRSLSPAAPAKPSR
jgi:Skp family chaperone for outer membrane proteins